jgi:hypothetical protein
MGSSPIFRRNEERPEIIENRLVDKVSGFCFVLKILAILIKISNFNIIFSNHLVTILEVLKDGFIPYTFHFVTKITKFGSI